MLGKTKLSVAITIMLFHAASLLNWLTVDVPEGRFFRPIPFLVLLVAWALMMLHVRLWSMRKLLLSLLMAMVLAGTASAAPAKPKSVIHVITIKWKADAKPAQIQKAISAAENITFPGVTRVWTRPIKMQLTEGLQHIIVMEFESEDSLKKYADSPAQKKFYEDYMAVREESRTHDITN